MFNNTTLLHVAAKTGSKEIYDQLIAAGAKDDILDKNGKTAADYLSKTQSADLASNMRAALQQTTAPAARPATQPETKSISRPTKAGQTATEI